MKKDKPVAIVSKKREAPSVIEIAKSDSRFLSKYAALFLTILGFLFITTAFAVLGYRISNENKKSAELLNVVGLEKTLSQQISKDILIIQKEWTESKKLNTKSFESLTDSARNFDGIYLALKSGGVARFNSSSHDIEALGSDYSADLEKLNNAWSPLKVEIELLAKAYKQSVDKNSKLSARDSFLNGRKTFSTEINDLNKDSAFPNDFINSAEVFSATNQGLIDEVLGGEINKTSNTFNLYANDILSNVEKLNDAINNEITKKEENNIKVQAGMTVLSLVLFFILTFYFLRKNIVSDFIIFNEDKEKKGILDNINEGLFLMDSNWNVVSEGSLFLFKLFGRKIPVNADFKQILTESVDHDTLVNAERFVNILISKNIKGSMIDSLNPLKLITLRAKDASGADVEKHVSVHFGQIQDANGQLKNILVGIQDSTEKQKLSMALKEEIRKNKETFSLLVKLGSQTNAKQVISLLVAIKKLIEESNKKLKEGQYDSGALMEFLKDLKNEVHGYKNDAGLYKVDILQKLLHDFEDVLIKIGRQESVTYESFLNIPYEFKTILETVDLIEIILGQKNIASSGGETVKSGNVAKIESNLRSDLEEAVWQVSAKLGKSTKLAFDDSKFGLEDVFKRNEATLRTCLIHLAKNSVVHGIENPDVRRRMGKEAVGLISIDGNIENGQLILKLKDNGAGLSTEKIAKKILELGLTSKPIESYTEEQIHQFIFEQSFSTADLVTVDAGRGIGLSYVKSAIESLGGMVTVASLKGQFTEFTLTIPM